MNNISLQNQRTRGIEWAPQIAFNLYYVLKCKPEPWFSCLGAWLSSDRIPDWSMTRWWGAWLHSFPLDSASLLQGLIRRAWRALHSVAYWSLSQSIYHDEAEWAGAKRQVQQHLFTEANLILSFPLTWKMAAWGNLLWLRMNSKKLQIFIILLKPLHVISYSGRH